MAQVIEEKGRLIIKVPFKEEFIKEFKSSIPARFRRWNEMEKTWIVGPEFLDEAREIVAKHFVARIVSQEETDWYAILHLKPTAPPELVTVAYDVLMDILDDDAEKAKVKLAFWEISKLQESSPEKQEEES